MSARSQIALILCMCLMHALFAQTKPFREAGHWGIKDGEQVIIPARYDTIFDFEETGKVCLACAKVKSPTGNRMIIKASTATYACHYLDRKNERLRIKAGGNDTCSVFSLGKNTVKQYNESLTQLVVAVKGKKHLVSKDFKQLTFNGYEDIAPSLDPGFYVAQVRDENETVLTGLVDMGEKEVVPYKYAHIRINPVDSLIMGCTAGIRENGEDDVYDYSGKKLASYRRHIEMATKGYVIQKIFEPKEHFVIYNIQTHEEKPLQASEVHFYEHDQVLIRIKDEWYVYDLITNQKKSKQY